MKSNNQDIQDSLIRAYWLQKFSGVENSHRPKKNIGENRDSRSIFLSKECSEDIRKLSKHNVLSVYTSFLAIYGFLVERYFGKTHIAFTPLKIQDVIHNPAAVTFFHLPQRSDGLWKDLVKDISREFTETLSYCNYSYLDLLESGLPEKKRITHSFYYSALNDLSIGPADDRMSLTIYESADDFRIEISFDPVEYSVALIGEFLVHFEMLSSNFRANLDRSIKDLDLVNAMDRVAIALSLEDDPERTVIHALKDIALQSPEQIAIVHNEKSISYRELDRLSNQLAAHLIRSYQVSPEDMIAVSMDKSIDSFVIMLGIMKARGVYVPIDPVYPENRKKYMLGDCNAKVLITSSAYVFDIDYFNGPLLAYDIQQPAFEQAVDLTLYPDPQQLSYVIYTSGTTGKPKGVAIEHAAVMSMIKCQNRIFCLDSSDAVLQFASMSFDASVYETFLAFTSGASLVLVDDREIQDPAAFVEYIGEKRVTMVTLPPSYLSTLSAKPLPTVRILVTAGEPPRHSDAIYYAQSTAYYNAYGPTENSVCSAIHQVDPKQTKQIPMGKALSNTRIFIMKDHQLQPLGVKGEICIEGHGLARGYLNNPELTADRFRINPYTGNRMYLSGDIGIREGELLLFSGRNDSQVKVRGYRVELAEIESQLLVQENIQEAIVLADKNSDDVQLIAFCKTSSSVEDQDLLAKEISNGLRENLPDYMIPSRLLLLSSFPLTVNGKIDRTALMQLALDRKDHDTAEPKTETQRILCTILQEALNVRKVGMKDNLISLGLDSIRAIRSVGKINALLQAEIDLAAIFKVETVEELAYVIEHDLTNRQLTTAWDYGNNQIDGIKNLIFQSPELVSKLPVGYEEFYPINDTEMGMIYSSLLRQEEPIYYDQFTYQVDIHQIDQFLKGLNELFQRHSNFRAFYYLSTFRRPLKVVVDQIDPPLAFTDLSAATDEEQKIIIAKYLAEDRNVRFRYEGELLWRMQFFKLSSTKFFIIWSCHHCLLDGWSQNLFVTELSNVLAGITLPPLKHTYKDHTAILLGKTASPEVEQFWSGYLEKYSRSKLPFNYSGKPRRADTTMLTVSDFIDAGVLAELEAHMSTYAFSLKAICVSAYMFLMHILTNETDCVSGVVSNDRPPIEDGDRIIGCFLNTIPIRIDFSQDRKIIDLIREVNKYLIDVKQYEVHLNVISKILGEKTTLANPVFDCIINFTDFHILNEYKDNTTVETNADFLTGDALQGSGMTNTIFDLEVDRKANGFGMTVKYNMAYIDQSEAEEALTLFSRIMKLFSGNINVELNSSTLLNENDRGLIAQEFNNTLREYDRYVLLNELLEQRAGRQPDHIAVYSGKDQISYSELNARANRIARLLIKKGVIEGDNVALIASRGIDLIVGGYAILKAGAAYVPIDPAYPVDRKKYIIDNSGVSHMLTDDEQSELRKQVSAAFISLKEDTSAFEPGNLPRKTTADKLAYTIYTSGSTGTPKGVMIEHHSAVNLITWVNRTFNIGKDDNLLFVTSICFDLSVYDIFGSLATGASITVADEENVREARQLIDLLRGYKITFWDSVPTTMSFVVSHLEAELNKEPLPHLRTVFLSGDWIPVSLPDRIKKIFPNASVISLGGATEGTVWSNYFPIQAVDPNWVSIPYGKPIDNNSFYILNSQKEQVPQGIVGELYIGGVGVARGYANDNEKTKNAFFPDPFTTVPDGRMYKTGDLGRMMPDGNMEFLGRKDNQVKIRGYRIELGEVEAVLARHPQVAECVVQSFLDRQNNRELCAYVVLRKEAEPGVLKEFMSAKLPDYMLPAFIIVLAELPLTSNGKIDRKALPVPEIQRSAHVPFTAPVGQKEKEVAAIWREILQVDEIGANDNLLELGAQSLNLGTFLNSIHRSMGVLLNLRDIFSQPTIKGITALIETSVQNKFLRISPIEQQDHYPLSHAQRRLWIIAQNESGNSAYNQFSVFNIEGIEEELFRETFSRIIARHEILRTSIVEIEGEPRQKIHAYHPSLLNFQVKDSTPGHASELIQQWIQNDFSLPLKPEDHSLFRITLIKVSPGSYIMVFVIHHIISDGWSIDILTKEFLTIYSSLQSTQQEQPPLRIQYKDYAFWHNDFLSDDRINEHKKYWLAKLGGGIQPLILPTDFSRPHVQSFNGAKRNFVMGGDLTADLQRVASDHNATLFMIFISTVQILLSRLTNQPDIIIGTPFSGRFHADLEDQIGFYVNTLPVRISVSKDDTFQSLLEKSKKTILDAQKHQLYPFDKLVSDLGIQRDMSRAPLFDILVTHQQETKHTLTSHNVALRMDIANDQHLPSRYDLSFDFSIENGNVMLSMVYNTDLFREGTIILLWEKLKIIFSLYTTDPSKTLESLNLETVAEKELQEGQEFKIEFDEWQPAASK